LLSPKQLTHNRKEATSPPLNKKNMSSSSIELPTGFASNILATANTTFSNFSSYIIMILGILLAAVVIEILISAFSHKK